MNFIFFLEFKSLISLLSCFDSFSLIMSSALSGLILSSQINQINVPFVESFQDLISKPSIVPEVHQPIYYKRFKDIFPEEFVILDSRRLAGGLNENKKTKFNSITELLLQLIKGESVYLCNGIYKNFILAENPQLPLVATNDKYFPEYFTFPVSKSHPFADKIMLAMYFLIEGGIFERDKTRMKVKASIIGIYKASSKSANIKSSNVEILPKNDLKLLLRNSPQILNISSHWAF